MSKWAKDMAQKTWLDLQKRKKRREEGQLTNKYPGLGKGLLQAYWQVACNIAKEEK